MLGSLNMDISVTVPRLPGPGATVLGSAARFTPGGKGANQAVAAARLGADVRMVGCVGDDDFGRQLLASLRGEGIDADAVRTVTGVPTGVAMIAVDRQRREPHHRRPRRQPRGRPARGRRGRRASRTDQTRTPRRHPGHQRRDPGPRDRRAPGRSPASASASSTWPRPRENARALVADAGDHLDWLVVNESEAAALLGRPVNGLAAAKRAAADLGRQRPPPRRGHRGRARRRPGRPGRSRRDRGFPVEPVDTVGAATRSSGRSPSPSRPASRRGRPSGRPPPRAPRPSPATGPRPPCPGPLDILAVTGLTWPVACSRGIPRQIASGSLLRKEKLIV